MLCYGNKSSNLSGFKAPRVIPRSYYMEIACLGALLCIILILGLRLMEVVPSGASPIVAVGEEGSRTYQLTNVGQKWHTSYPAIIHCLE